MTIGERIKKVRKEKHLTQQELAKKIGSVQNTITGYETGRREPSSAVISLICREFQVNEAWLRTGEGEMFSQPSSQAEQVVAWVQNIFTNGTEAEKGLITAMSTFTKEDWAMLAHLIKKIWESQQAAPAPPVEEPAPENLTDEEKEILRQLRLEKSTKMSTASPSIA